LCATTTMSSPVPHRIALTARLNIEVRDGEQRCWSAGAAGVVFNIQQIVYEIEQDLVKRFEQHRVELNWGSLDVESSIHLVQGASCFTFPEPRFFGCADGDTIPVTPTSPPDTQPVVTVATSSTTDPPVGTPPGPESSITAPPIQVPLADQMPVVTLAHQTQTLPRTRSRSPFLNPEVRLRRNRNLRRHKVPCRCRCECRCACGCGRCGSSFVPGRDPDPDPEPRSVRGMCRQGVCADCLNGVAPRTEARPVLPFQLTDEYVMELHQRVCIRERFGGANSRGGDFGQ
jgi:hypothetical protein